ncbi:GNAT family N-acetyltransferase [candidate division KSB1 bacterium]|nr:GNAT family N-acetyltransferase [candidate division KSB1 bacterium]NIR72272.1 GNAT family N-acetyltransferase [candidate division KSB1 bacterium]NIS24243.1 GNAT family N-acetyltransferase [candidate division KSB1 bacterium]NIT71157.1 GNAT family N-acetyltransferase [candidate division KSB1 bacterium]NIU24862.1 GNAT family N-acetyltransferase [candidate division KSB1 bacterium]
MKLNAYKTELQAIQSLRNLFLQESNFQIRYHACHERGWSDSYLLMLDDREVGYGSIKGQEIKDRDTIFEFYMVPPFRKLASRFFPELIATSRANLIECQSNDSLLSSMLYEFSHNINADTVLFADHTMTNYAIPSVVFRARREDDQIFEHKVEPVGEYVLELDGEVVATGGYALYYNMPFADLYMEVREDCRKRGFGSFLLQELKKKCYLVGRVPAARCSIRNQASRATLVKAGLRVVGFMLKGDIKNTNTR